MSCARRESEPRLEQSSQWDRLRSAPATTAPRIPMVRSKTGATGAAHSGSTSTATITVWLPPPVRIPITGLTSLKSRP